MRRFALEIEDLAVLRSDQAKALFVDVVVGLGAVGELGAVLFAQVRVRGRGELVLEGVEKTLAAADAFFGFIAAADALRGADVFRGRAWVLHGEGGVGHAEEAGAVRAAADRDIVRQRDVLIAGELRDLVGRHRTDRGKRQRRVGRVGGVHQLAATHVIAFRRGQGTDDGQVAHLLGNLGHVLGNLDAGDGSVDLAELAAGRLARLKVPDIDGRGAAAHPQDDDTLVLAAQLLSIGLDVSHEFESGQRQGGITRHVREKMSSIHPRFIGHV